MCKTKGVIFIENQKVILYSTPTCGVCKMIEAELIKKKIPYEKCFDMDVMSANGVMSVPTLQVGSKLYQAADSYKWIESQEVFD